MKRITLFSWGYWGWGNATPELRRMVDAVERERGFAPPMFVDIRYSRSARAEGFRSHTFEDLLGRSRYRWMRSLGNRAIRAKSGPRMVIDDPSGAEELIDLAASASKQNKRVLFFCACDFPRWKGKSNCHRDRVGTLLLNSAMARGTKVEVVEWPGGNSSDIELEVPSDVVKSIERGSLYFHYGRRFSMAQSGAIAFGSRLILRSPASDLFAIIGPARYQNSDWVLPIFSWWSMPLSDHKGVHPKKESAAMRREYGFEPRLIA